MKKILITGANSYIGTSFEKYIKDNFSDQYQVDTSDMIDGSWRDKSFAEYVNYLDENHFIPPNSRNLLDFIRKQGNEPNHQIVIKTNNYE